MNITTRLLALAIATFSFQASAQAIDVAAFLKERGAERAALRQLARSPNPAVVPVAFHEKNGMAPTCGLLVADPRAKKLRYIDILGADSDSTFPQWRLLERDFIAGDTSSFATFEDGHAHACHVELEAGARPLSANLADVASTTGCAGVLAATQLAAPAATYYVSMFRSDAGKQLVAIASIANDGTPKIEKDLSADINGAGATGDIRAARTALSQRLGALRNPPTRQ